jgi:CBS-domain-containing membrane protein
MGVMGAIILFGSVLLHELAHSIVAIRYGLLTSILSGIRLGSIMNSHIIAVRKDIVIDRLIYEYFNTSTKDLFPVTDDFGHLVGMVTAKDAIRVPEYRRNLEHVIDIMIQKPDLMIMNTENTVDDVLKRMGSEHSESGIYL